MDKEQQLAEAREKAAEANKGNTHSSKNNRLLSETLKRVLIQGDGNNARAIAEALVLKAVEGDISAIKEVFDRMEGKSVAKQEISGPDGGSINVNMPIEIINGNNKVSE